jgi:hypothetical protein
VPKRRAKERARRRDQAEQEALRIEVKRNGAANAGRWTVALILAKPMWLMFVASSIDQRSVSGRREPTRLSRPAALVALFSLSWILGTTSEVLARSEDSASDRVQLVFESDGTCSSEKAFAREVRARVRRPISWVERDAETLIVVKLTAGEAAAVGSVEVLRLSAPPTRRDFDAHTCAEVSSALALVVALTLDPNANLEPLESVAPAASPVARRPAAARQPERGTSSSRLYVGPAAGAASGYVPGGLVTFGAVLGWRTLRRGWFTPGLQLTPQWAETGTTGPAVASATFSWAIVRLDACPVHLKLARHWGLVPCISGEAGRVSASGRSESIDVPEAATRPWGAAGGSLLLRYNASPWFGSVSSTLLAPMTRDEWVFLQPKTAIHETPALVSGALLAAGIEL